MGMTTSGLNGETIVKDSVSSISDDRTVNNVAHHEYRVLTDEEKEQMKTIKDMGRDFIKYIQGIETWDYKGMRENILAVERIEEAVMWAVKGVTK